MGFFKNLKDRLFKLKTKEELEEQKKILEEAKLKAKEEKKLQKIQIKLEKDQKKEIAQLESVQKFVTGLNKSNSNFSKAILELQNNHVKLDDDFFEELEEILIMSDISAKLALLIIDEIQREVKIQNIDDPKIISEIIVDKMFLIYANKSFIDINLNYQEQRMNVFLMVGVNGSGKTTSIAKIAKRYKDLQKKILIIAGDTFRAAASEQLEIWANRVGVEIFKASQKNQEPASVVYQGLEYAKNNNFDLVIIDTAGRLQNKINLMNELEKINKIINKFIGRSVDESLLVIDATTGQNGVSQARSFKEVTNLTGIVLTKMDGTSKGGIVLSIKDEFDLNVKLIGLGEKMDDLVDFDLDSFIYGMTKDLIENYEKK
ncbi:CELL DIVISION PROTEIN FTSY [Mycoplasmopsis pulmonis]|uniref:Signal recognition particle receptor FtsY n=1 Tax=Mycoplasmopsis pulmonis (strain UAB CTIP) TaxID=272635 RepID=Q98PP5_MYCPU|nr:signal recognition particle-docking protein FtsY [Mycoplasmopsis pulmonis]MDZ7293694.1 signal recognition particle-docking protein FtsY [Mycoplasmopsis pulmonis]CAC13847.1 CELL DIVISION PROTEIN FTSY [Mycoplasmopsis pulmonis]VEU68441.1 cell division protein FTSY [Mycoplasmopsis pulmonis]